MDLPKMTYVYHSLPSGGMDMFKKLKDFLETNNWKINEYREDCEWGSLGGIPTTYGWKSGTERFLDFESKTAVVGNQKYRWNLQMYNYTYDDDDVALRFAGVEPDYNNGDYDFVSYHPVRQSSHSWGPLEANGCVIRMPRSTFTGCYFFTNGISVWIVVQPTAGTCMLFGLGTPELFNEYYNKLDVQVFWGALCSITHSWKTLTNNTEQAYWVSGDGFPYNSPSTMLGYYWRIEGVARTPSDNHLVQNIYLNKNDYGSQKLGYMDNLNDAVEYLGYNAMRPAFVPDIYIKRKTTGIYEYVGRLPLAKIKTLGLPIGTKLTYGKQEYLAFPNLNTQTTYGTIFRIK